MISIVMAYYNRGRLLETTLRSIMLSECNPEIIIVDDGSDEDERIEKMTELYDFNIKVIRVEPKDKTWTSACIPFNIGFREAKGDIIVIQSPECMHVGDVLKYTEGNVVDNKYIAFACYSANQHHTDTLNRFFFSSLNAELVLAPFNNAHPSNDGEDGWYNHSEYNPNGFAFCAAMTKKDLDELGGFDERYAHGIGYEDFEFMARIRRKGMSVEIIDNPYVVHQRHKPTDYEGKKELHNRNHKLFYTGQL